MKKTINVILLAIPLLLILGLIIAINADVKPNDRNMPKDNPENNQKFNLSPSDVPKLVEIIKVWKLIDEVELDEINEDKMVIFLAKYKQLDKIRFKFHRERAEAIKKLQNDLKSNSSEEQIKLALINIKKIESDYMQKEKQLMNAINASLSTKQQAEFIVFQDTYWREMRQMMKNLKELSLVRDNNMKYQPEVLSQK